MKIKLNKSKNIKSNNKDSLLSIQLSKESKIINDLNINHKINSFDVYNEEHNKSSLYRLILTIKPFCTNILFNPLSIILDGDEDKGIRIFDDSTKNGFYSSVKDFYTDSLYKPQKYVENGYHYLPGFNIFDNNTFRTNLFKKSNSLGDTYKPLMSNIDGEKHVYELDDISSFASTIGNKINEVNGWVGFIIPPKLNTINTSISSNFFYNVNKKACDFLDLYPDRSLFSFLPKYRENNNRYEKNWDVVLTYPYKSFYDNNLVKSESNNYITENGDETSLNGILVLSQKIITLQYNKNVLSLKLCYNSNLKNGDKIRLTYVSGNNIKYNIVTVYDVLDNNIIYVIGYDTTLHTLKVDSRIYRIEHVINGVISKYYIRLFKKLPNWKFSKEIITENNVDNEINKNLIDFTSNNYPLSFASTIYSDRILQYTFTDNIDIKFLKDNLNRPLSEIYISILKNNTGYKLKKEFSEITPNEKKRWF